MDGLKRVIRDEPALLSEAMRLSLLAVVLLGFTLTDEQVLAIVAAFSAILAVMTRAMVTPTGKFDAAVNREAENIAEAIVTEQAEPLTPEERASLDQLRAERDRLRNQHEARRLAVQRKKGQV